jgi:hypothetical protein
VCSSDGQPGIESRAVFVEFQPETGHAPMMIPSSFPAMAMTNKENPIVV